MNLPAVSRGRAQTLALPKLDLGRIAAWLLPFALVLYLGLRGGGYDTVVRGQVGVAVWWIVLFGGLAGILPFGRIGRRGWIGLGLLAAFAVWTSLALGWSDSSERTFVEVGRVAAYLGIFALALAALARRSGRGAVNGVATGIAAIAVLAVLSRLHPAWFPENDAARFLGEEGSRLNYPLNYWNGLAALMALGTPLLLSLAASARTLAGRAAACAALPVVGLCAWLTFSRGGALAIGVGLVVLFALMPNRVSLAVSFALGGGGAAVAILSIVDRDAVQYAHHSGLAESQGRQMIAVLLVVCVGVALLQVAVAMLGRRVDRPDALWQMRKATAYGLGAVLAIGVLAVAIAPPQGVSSRWEDFKKPKLVLTTGQERFESSSGRGRYQYWQAASKAERTEPVQGRGPGTFELWWSRKGTLPGFVRDAHSLYMETYGETGLVGFALLVGFLGFVLATGATRVASRRVRGRSAIAAATAGCAAFCMSASVDWVWELSVLPAAFMVLAAVVLVSGDRTRRRRWPARQRAAVRAAAVGLAVLALVAVLVPLLTASDIRDSRDRAAAGDLAGALRASLAAQEAQPDASAPRLQRALLLEAAGALKPAAVAAREATERGPDDWRNWIIRSRIDAERGAAASSVRAYRTARALNPRGRIFSAQ